MAIETVRKYQMHLLAYEVPGTGKWDAFLTMSRFDDARQDFVNVVEKEPVADHSWDSYDDAIEAARRFANAMIRERGD